MAATQVYLENEPLVNADLCKKWLFWGILWTLVFPLVGVVVSIKFNYPDWLGGTSWLTWGRIRPMHVNGVIFGAFSTTFFGLMFYMVPKLTGIRMVGEKMGYWCLWLWNIGIVMGSYSLMAGYQKGIEAGDYALWADVPLIIAFIVLTYMAIATIIKRKEKLLYIALYYLAGAMVWTAINFPLGNILLPYWVPGVNNAALHGLYIHYIVGLWITPAGLSLIYFFLPLACKN
ncbi:MAG: cbb3-type cytochrome c oxidase subunit I, partial [Candidatus Acidiferrales bacterium]